MDNRKQTVSSIPMCSILLGPSGTPPSRMIHILFARLSPSPRFIYVFVIRATPSSGSINIRIIWRSPRTRIINIIIIGHSPSPGCVHILLLFPSRHTFTPTSLFVYSNFLRLIFPFLSHLPVDLPMHQFFFPEQYVPPRFLLQAENFCVAYISLLYDVNPLPKNNHH